MNFSPHSRSNTPKSNAALLLTLFVPVTPLLRYSYKKMGGTPLPRNGAEACAIPSPTSNSFGINLLLGFAGGPPNVSPLESELCRKQGGVGGTRISISSTPTFNLRLSTDPVTTSVFYHLRQSIKMPQKSPNVFYHLQAMSPVSTCIFYLLQKRREGEHDHRIPQVSAPT
jgi:hypothetical protein